MKTAPAGPGRRGGEHITGETVIPAVLAVHLTLIAACALFIVWDLCRPSYRNPVSGNRVPPSGQKPIPPQTKASINPTNRNQKNLLRALPAPGGGNGKTKTNETQPYIVILPQAGAESKDNHYARLIL